MTRFLSLLAVALALTLPVAADPALRGGTCGQALTAAAELAAANGAPITITHVQCGGVRETIEIRRTALSGKTVYDVRVRESRSGPRTVRAAEARDFSADSPARVIRVR